MQVSHCMRIPKERHHSCKKSSKGKAYIEAVARSTGYTYIYMYMYIHIPIYTYTSHNITSNLTEPSPCCQTPRNRQKNCGGTPINLNKPQADIYKPSNLHTLCPIYGHAVTTKHVKYPNVASGALARCSGTKKIALPSSLWSLRDLDTYRVDDG